MAVSPIPTTGSAGNWVASSAGNGVGNATTTLSSPISTLDASTWFLTRVIYKVTYPSTAPTNGVFLSFFDVTATITSTDPALILPISTAAGNATVVSKAGLLGPGKYVAKLTNNDATACTVEVSYENYGSIG